MTAPGLTSLPVTSDDPVTLIDAGCFADQCLRLAVPRAATSIILGNQEAESVLDRASAPLAAKRRRFDSPRPGNGLFLGRVGIPHRARSPAEKHPDELFPKDSIASLSGAHDLINRITLSDGIPWCEKCGEPGARRDTGALLDALDKLPPRGVAVIAVPIVDRDTPADQLLDLFGSERLVIGNKLRTRNDIGTSTRASRGKKAPSLSVVIGTAELPLSTEKRLEITNWFRRAGEGGSEGIAAFHFLSRDAEGSMLGIFGEVYFCPRCSKPLQASISAIGSGAGGTQKRPGRRAQARKDEWICHGARPSEIEAMTVRRCGEWCARAFTDATPPAKIALEYLKRVTAILTQLGFGECDLARSVSVLSSGEAIRLELARFAISNVSDLVLVFDGSLALFDSREFELLRGAFRSLTEAGNTCCIAGFDARLAALAAWVVDSSGVRRSEVTERSAARAARPLEVLYRRNPAKAPPVKEWADAISLKQGEIVSLSGVSGIGKSLLLEELARRMSPRAQSRGGERMFRHVRLLSAEDRLSGERDRSVAAVSGLDRIFADAFAATAAARIRGLSSDDFLPERSRFRCHHCNGRGLVEEGGECSACSGCGFEAGLETITLGGLNISEIVSNSLSSLPGEAAAATGKHEFMNLLRLLGLEQVSLGASVHTLSESERQRIQLATLLASRPRNRTRVRAAAPMAVLLDYPFLGMGGNEIDRCIELLRDYAQGGDTFVCVDSGPQFQSAADRGIDIVWNAK